MSEKELEEYLEKLIDKQFTTKYAGAEQAQRIAKDIKNGKSNFIWKDVIIVMATMLGMLTVIYYSAQANSKSDVVSVCQTSHEKLNAEQFSSLDKRMERIEGSQIRLEQSVNKLLSRGKE